MRSALIALSAFVALASALPQSQSSAPVKCGSGKTVQTLTVLSHAINAAKIDWCVAKKTGEIKGDKCNECFGNVPPQPGSMDIEIGDDVDYFVFAFKGAAGGEQEMYPDLVSGDWPKEYDLQDPTQMTSPTMIFTTGTAQRCSTDTDCPCAYCMNDSSKKAPFFCHDPTPGQCCKTDKDCPNSYCVSYHGPPPFHCHGTMAPIDTESFAPVKCGNGKTIQTLTVLSHAMNAAKIDWCVANKTGEVGGDKCHQCFDNLPPQPGSMNIEIGDDVDYFVFAFKGAAGGEQEMYPDLVSGDWPKEYNLQDPAQMSEVVAVQDIFHVSCKNKATCLQLNIPGGQEDPFWKANSYKYNITQHPECAPWGATCGSTYPQEDSVVYNVQGFKGVDLVKYGKPFSSFAPVKCGTGKTIQTLTVLSHAMNAAKIDWCVANKTGELLGTKCAQCFDDLPPQPGSMNIEIGDDVDYFVFAFKGAAGGEQEMYPDLVSGDWPKEYDLQDPPTRVHRPGH